jgi:hypothetical protein
VSLPWAWAGAGAGGGAAGVGGSADVTIVRNRTSAFIGDGAWVNAGKDIDIIAKSDKYVNSLVVVGAGGGAAGVAGAVSIMVIGSVFDSHAAGGLSSNDPDDPGSTQDTVDGQITESPVGDMLGTSDHAVRAKGTVDSKTAGIGIGDSFNATSEVSLNNTQAFIGFNARVNAGGNLTVRADDKTIAIAADAAGAGGGAAGVSGVICVVLLHSKAEAFIAANAVTNAGLNTKVEAKTADNIFTAGIAGSGAGAAAVNGVAQVKVVRTESWAYIANDALVNQDIAFRTPLQSVFVTADGSTYIVSAGCSGGGAGAAAVGGVINIGVFTKNTQAFIGERARVAAQKDIVVAAESSQLLVGVSVAVFGAGAAAVSGVAGTFTFINTTEAYIGSNAVVDSDGNVKVSAADDSLLISVTAVGTGAGAAAVAGAISVNVIASVTRAYIAENATVNARGNSVGISVYTGGLGDAGMLPGGAWDDGIDTTGNGEPDTWLVVDKSLEVDADDDELPSGGSVNGEVNFDIGDTNINAPGEGIGAKLTETVKGLSVVAVSNQKFITVTIAIAGAGVAGVSGAATVNVLAAVTEAYVGDGAVINGNNSGAHNEQSVLVRASGNALVVQTEGTVGAAGVAGVSGSVNTAVISSVTKAHLGGTVNARRDIIVVALSKEELDLITANVSGGGIAGVGAAAGVGVLSGQTLAYIKAGSNLSAGRDLTVYAKSDVNLNIDTLSGAGGGIAGVGGAVTVGVITRTTKAYVENATGTGTAAWLYAARTMDIRAESVIETFGLAVSGAGGGAAGVAGAINVMVIGTTTQAYIGSFTRVNQNNPGGENQTVRVWAKDTVKMTGAGGSGSVSGIAGVGASVDVAVLRNTVTAYIGPSALVYAKRTTSGGNVDVRAESEKQVDSYVIAASGGLAAGIGGAVSVISIGAALNSDSRESLADASSFVDREISGISVSGQLGDSEHVQGTESSVTAKLDGLNVSDYLDDNAADSLNRTRAYIGAGAKVTADNNINVYAGDSTRVSVLAGGVGIGAVGVGGGIGIVIINTTTEAFVDSGAELSAVGTITVEAKSREKDATPYTVTAFGGAAGLVGIGAAVAYLDVENHVWAYLNNNAKILRAAAVNVLATEENKLNATAVGVSAGYLGAAGASLARATHSGSVEASLRNNVSVANTGTLTLRSVWDSTADAEAIAGAAGVGLSLNGAVALVTVDPEVRAYLGTNVNIDTNGNIVITAQSLTGAKAQAFGVSAGALAVGASLAYADVAPVVAAYISGGTVNSRGSITLQALHNYNTNGSLENRTVTASATAPAGGLVSLTGAGAVAESSPDIRAYTGTNSVLSADGTITLRSLSHNNAYAKACGVAVGIGAIGAAVADAEVNGGTRAYLNGQVTGAPYLTIEAGEIASAKAESFAAAGGLVAGSVNKAEATVTPTVESYLGTGARILVLNDVNIDARVTPSATADAFGINAGAAAIGASIAEARVAPVVNAYVGVGSVVVIGFEILPGNPVLTFASDAVFSGGGITFVSKLAQVIGTFSFIPGTGGNYDTITRSSGSWLTDGFVAGYPITVTIGTDSNVYNVIGVTDNALTLDSKGAWTATQNNMATITSGKPPGEIRRSSGSWLDDGFFPGQLIEVSGSTHNNGHFQIEAISGDGRTLFLGVSDEITNETMGAGQTVTIRGDTPDRIRRAAGSWLADGFEPGQTIRVNGTEYNDGMYQIKSISADGKVLILDTLDLLTRETRNGVSFARDALDKSTLNFVPVAGSLTFASDASYTGTNISFAHKGGVMTGNPELTFTPGDTEAGTYDRITRSAGSWITNGFKVGQIIVVETFLKNNVAEMTGTLTFTPGTGGGYDTISRSVGSWRDEGFEAGMWLEVEAFIKDGIAQMTRTADLTLDFAAGTEGGHDTITRNTGSWLADGFTAGQHICITIISVKVYYRVRSVTATVLTLDSQGALPSLSGVPGSSISIESGDMITYHQVRSVSTDGKVLTLQSQGAFVEQQSGVSGVKVASGEIKHYFQVRSVTATVLTLESQGLFAARTGVTGATVESGSEIRRSTGSWLADGFYAGQPIQVSGSQSNNRQYLILGISANGRDLFLDYSTMAVTETHGLTVTVSGDTPDRITRASGSWLTDYSEGQWIRIAGTQYNDGLHRIWSISEDGREITLATLDALQRETASGVSFALTNPDTEKRVWHGSLTVSARQLTPAGGITASARAFGSGGGLISVQANEATAANDGQVRSGVLVGADLQVSGTVNIDSFSIGTQRARTDGYNAGIGAANSNHATAESGSITESYLQNGVVVLSDRLSLNAAGSNDNYAESVAGSGGLLTLVLIKAETEDTSRVTAYLGTRAGSGFNADGLHIGVNQLQINADYLARFNSKADGISAALVGIGNTKAYNNISPTVEIKFGSGASVLTKDLVANANNRAEKDWLPGSAWNVQSKSGALLDIPATKSETIIVTTTVISVLDDATLAVFADDINPGRLSLNAFNSVLARDKAKLENGGLIAVTDAHSLIISTCLATVEIGARALLANTGDIDLTTRTNQEIQTYTFSITYIGGVGIATGDARSVANTTNHILVDSDAELYAGGNINLLAGHDTAGRWNYYDLKANILLYNYTAVPLATSPTARATIDQDNNITIGSGAELFAIKDAKLLTNDGITLVTAEGIGKNLYQELLGIDLREGNLADPIKSNSLVRVDGTIRVGIKNKLWLIIDVNGNPLESGPQSWMTLDQRIPYITRVESRVTNLLEELETLHELYKIYAGTDAGFAYQLQIERVLDDLAELGFGEEVLNPLTGQMEFRVEHPFVQYIIISNVVAQSSYIYVDAHNFAGTGTLIAPGDSEIYIENRSTSFLRIAGLTIPETGGDVVFNGWGLTDRSSPGNYNQYINSKNSDSSKVANFSFTIGTTPGNLPSITVKNTHPGISAQNIPAPDIEVTGEINNIRGTLLLQSEGAVIVYGDINVAVNHTIASKFVLNFVDTIFNAGGEPSFLWALPTRITEKVMVRTAPFSKYNYRGGVHVIWSPMGLNTAIIRALGEPPRSTIQADTIYLSARYLNINGTIQAGREYNITFGAGVAQQIQRYRSMANPPLNYLDAPLLVGGNFTAYYDISTNTIIVENLRVRAGYAELFGQIMNTHSFGGNIRILDGFGNITVNNQTGYDILFKGMDNSNSGEGKLVIYDTAWMHYYSGCDQPVKVVYERINGVVSVTGGEIKNAAGTVIGQIDLTAGYYNPYVGQRYVWTTAIDITYRTVSIYRKATWLGLIHWSPGDLHSQSVRPTSVPIPIREGDYVVLDLVNTSQPYLYTYERHVTDDPTVVSKKDWVVKTWYGKRTYYTEVVEITGIKEVHHHSIRADYPIAIVFVGSETGGSITVTSNGRVIIDGPVTTNAGGSISFTSSNGSIERGGSDIAIITGKNITLWGKNGIGNNLELLIDLRGGVLNATAEQGRINIREINGDLVLHRVVNPGGDIILFADNSILSTGTDPLVKGRLIELTAGRGTIGSATQPLLIESLTGLWALANGNINLKQVAGDLNLVKVESGSGNVRIEVAAGSLTDANHTEEEDGAARAAIITIWNSQNLSGTITAEALNNLLRGELARLVNTSVRVEEYNVWGNDIFLKASGSIGHKYDVRIDLPADIAQLDMANIILLAAAEPGDVKYYSASGQQIVPNNTTTPVAYIIISQREDVNVVAKRRLDAEAGNDVYIGSGGNIPLGVIKGDEVRIKSGAGITNYTGGTAANIICGDLLLEAAAGTIGAADKPINISKAPASAFTARALGNIFLSGVASDGLLGALNINHIYTIANVTLTAADFIGDANNDNRDNIACNTLHITAKSIGTAANFLDIKLAGLVNATATGGDIFLAEAGSMNVGLVSATGNVNLTAQNSILDARDDNAANVSGTNITLTAVSGGIGSADNYFDIQHGGSGWVSAASQGNIYLRKVSGDLALNRLSGTGTVYLISNSGIVNRRDAAGSNILSDKLWFSAATGVGSADKPVLTTVRNIEGTAGGSIWITNSGALTVGGVEAGTDGITAGGEIHLVTMSPITVTESLTAGSDIVLTAVDSAGPGDDITVRTGATIRSTGGAIILRAGDNITLEAGSSLRASGMVILVADFGDADPGVGAVINVHGTIEAQSIWIEGNDNNDTFNLTEPFTCPVDVYGMGGDDVFNLTLQSLAASIRLFGGAGDDTFNIYQLPSLISEVNGVRDTVTLDGQAGSDTYNIWVNGATDCHYIINVWDTGGDDYSNGNGGGNGDDNGDNNGGENGDGTGEDNSDNNGNGDGIGEDNGDNNNNGDNNGAENGGDVDRLIIHGTAEADVFLLRRYFIAVLHESGKEFSDEFERINYNENIEHLILYGYEGNDRFYLDDNSALTTIYGGDGNDFFQIGQMFGSPRTADDIDTLEEDRTGILPGDDIDTVHTTRGYLSYGVRFETTIWGDNGTDCEAGGHDIFSVYSNRAQLNLKGEGGNDTFIVRCFALADQYQPVQEETAVSGGNGDDYIRVSNYDNDDDIQYHVNAPVSIDGGAGFNTVVIIGTEFSDTFVITAYGVYGAGRTVEMTRIQSLDIDGMEGNDHFYIHGTREGMVTTVIGGLGSDTFYIMGDVTRNVVLSPGTSIERIVAHDLASDPLDPEREYQGIQGPLYILGGIKEGADRTLYPGIRLPYEKDKPLPGLEHLEPVDEDEMSDHVIIYNDGSTRNDAGWLKGVYDDEQQLIGGNLSGLGMGGEFTVNTGTTEEPDWVTFAGGITFYDIEIMEILLGSGHDTFTIEDTAARAITVVHGGGGDDHIIIEGRTGPLVIFGDTSACGTRYSSIPTEESVNGNSFSNTGNNTIDARNSAQSVVIYGGPGNDFIYGSQTGDFLAGGPGDDTIYAGGGNNIIFGDSAFNVNVRVHLKNDDVDLWTHLLTVVTTDSEGESLPIGNDTIITGLPVDGDPNSVEEVTISDGNNIIFGDLGTVTVMGNVGEDTWYLFDAGTWIIDIPFALVRTATASTAGGNDEITAGSGDNIIFGGIGDDFITTGGGDNIIFGDNGFISFENGIPVLIESTDPEHGGDDDITTGSGDDIIIGGTGNDTIDAGEGDNIVFGDNGHIELSAGVPVLIKSVSPEHGGVDDITTGSGDDIIIGGTGNDTIDAGEGDNIVFGDNGHIELAAGVPVLIKSVSPEYEGADDITTGSGHDIIIGGTGNDTIDAGDGNNIVFGDNGHIELSAGVPVLIKSVSPEHGGVDDITTGSGHDIIIGGTGNDTIAAGTVTT